MVNTILKEKVKEVDNLENIIKTKNKNTNSKNELVFNKLKENLNKIKTELNDVITEVDKKNINEDIFILNNIIQKNEDSTKNETISINNINDINKIISIKNKSSPDIFITKNPPPKNVHHTKNINFFYNNCNSNYKSIIIQKEKFNQMLKKNNSLSLLQNDTKCESIKSRTGEHKNFKKINFRFRNKNMLNNHTSSTLNIPEQKGKMFFKKKINFLPYDFNKINCNDISDEDYKNLLDKKENYMEESERISKNIQDINKSFLSKYSKIVNNLKKNINKLNEIKVINTGLLIEIKKLQDLMSQIQGENKKNKENE